MLSSEPTARAKILVASGEPALVERVHAALATTGHEVVTVAVEEAVRALERRHGPDTPTALVFDLALPPSGVWDLNKWLKWHPTLLVRVPVITIDAPRRAVRPLFQPFARLRRKVTAATIAQTLAEALAVAGEVASRDGAPPPRSTFEEQFADRLRIAMMRAGLGQSDVARASSVNQTTVSRWLAAKTNPNLSQLRRVLQVLNVPLGELLGMETEEKREDGDVRLVRGESPDEWLVFRGRSLAGRWTGRTDAVFPGARFAVGAEADELKALIARERPRSSDGEV